MKKKGTADARKKAEENDYMQQMEKVMHQNFLNFLSDRCRQTVQTQIKQSALLQEEQSDQGLY